MDTLENIEGYFKARCSYLVCKHSSIQPALVTKNEYQLISAKFEAEVQKEINYLLNSCEDEKSFDLLDFLNRLLKISDEARKLFMEINNPKHKHVVIEYSKNTGNRVRI